MSFLRKRKNYDSSKVSHSVAQIDDGNEGNESEKPKRKQTEERQTRRCSCIDSCCWFIGCICSIWWFLLFMYNAMPASFPQYVTEAITGPLPDPPGMKLRKEGLTVNHPVVFVPGIVTGGLELWEGHPCADGLFRKRLWGGSFGELYKRPLCWVEHMSLDNETGLDPPGVRVRPVSGLVAADYFAPGYFVWAVLIANLARIGYEEKTMYMAAYDWRLSFQNTEVRDQTLSRIKSNIELMVATNGGKKVVVIPHSMGALYFLHFMKWVEAPAPMGGGGGPDWCAKHIKAVMNIGGPFLGVPKAVSGLFSSEAKDIAVFSSLLNLYGFVGGDAAKSRFNQGTPLTDHLEHLPLEVLLRLLCHSAILRGIATLEPRGIAMGQAALRAPPIGGALKKMAFAPGVLDKDVFGLQTLQHMMRMTRTWDSTMSMIPKGGDSIWGGLDWSPEGYFNCRARKLKNNENQGTDPNWDGSLDSTNTANYGRIISFGKETAQVHSSKIRRANFKDSVKGGNLANTTPCDVWIEYHGMHVESIKAIADYRVYTANSILDLLNFVAPKLMARGGAHFSYGIADDLDNPKYEHYKYWSNPLETKLPNAPDMEIYSMYGVGIPTERAYVYKLAPTTECYIPFQIDSSAESLGEDTCLTGGVFSVDGDETVPVLSAGFMCAKAWRGKTRFNPSGIRTYIREYDHAPPANLLEGRGTQSGAHVDIMGNFALIEDILRVAAGATGEDLGGDRVYSAIFNWSESIKLQL